MRAALVLLAVFAACARDSGRPAPATTRDSTALPATKDSAMATTPPDASIPAAAPDAGDAPPASMIPDEEWGRAEQVLRDHLAAKAITFTKIGQSRWHAMTVFLVVLADGRGVTALVEGDDAWVEPAPDLGFVADYLRRVHWLERRGISADEVFFLARTFGTVPGEVAKNLGLPNGGVHGYPATIDDAKDGGARVIGHFPRPLVGRPPGATAGKKMTLAYRATLSISKTYQLTWKVEEVEVPFIKRAP